MTDVVHQQSMKNVFAAAPRTWREFEIRPQQTAMAEAIREALSNDASLIVEAPTGVGKTLAYLLPSILDATSRGRKAVISTHTKNLQDQLLTKDIPLAHQLLAIPFHAVVMKGRRNYLCTSRLSAALESAARLFNNSEQDQLDQILAWSSTTKDGDLSSLPFAPSASVVAMVSSEPGICNPRDCRANCFYHRSRELAKEADVVIMNHALFFQLLQRSEDDDRFVFEDDFVIFDEAHTLEQVASSVLGLRVSTTQVRTLVSRLYHPRTHKGLFAKRKRALTDRVRQAVKDIDAFFVAVMAEVGKEGQSSAREIRIRSPHLIDNRLTETLQQLKVDAESVAKDAGERMAKELRRIAVSLEETDSAMTKFLDQSMDGCAYWIESSRAKDPNVTLCASPWDVAPILGPKLFNGRTSVILTSATIATQGNPRYFQSRLGALEIPFLSLDSPFDFQHQMRIAIAPDMPPPDRASEYGAALPSRVLQAIDRTEGRALVLFTNTKQLQEVAGLLRQPLEDRRIKLLAQDRGEQRHQLLEEFKSDIASVLFGVDSFWMGVDVPGESLQHVIITRLPFAVPSHPLTEARTEAIEERGGSAFTHYALPEAVLKFRQGAGRLIRNKDDIGIITILDSRISSKSYGRIFIESLPRCPVEFVFENGEIRSYDEEMP